VRVLSRSRRTPLILTILALVVAVLLASWCLSYRPWEAHYRGHPTSWWAAQYPAGQMEHDPPPPPDPQLQQLWIDPIIPADPFSYCPGPRPKAFWYDWAAAVGMKSNRDDDDEMEQRALFLGDPDSIPVLRELSGHPSPRVRQAAVYGLMKVGKRNPGAAAELAAIVAKGDSDSLVCRCARHALRKLDPEAAERAGIRADEP
jgi:hypothetical protein